MAIPLSDSRETKVWRSSRGVHSSARPALLQMVRSDRRTSAASSWDPCAVVKTSPLSCQRSPARSRLPLSLLTERFHRHPGESQRTPGLPRLGVSVGAYGAPDVDVWRYRRLGGRVALQVDVIPA